MPAYLSMPVEEFVATPLDAVHGLLQSAYAADGFSALYTTQSRAWEAVLVALNSALRSVAARGDGVHVLLEYPLYRLRRRIDIIFLVNGRVVVVEAKVNSRGFEAADRRQAEEYALDLRDFHGGCSGIQIIPALWSTAASEESINLRDLRDSVMPVQLLPAEGIGRLLEAVLRMERFPSIDGPTWNTAPYRPVPSIVQAATLIFAQHDVRAIARADATNLSDAAHRIVSLISTARRDGRRLLLMLTGVPGSGKTLVGLQVVHDSVATGAEQEGDVVYLSGNTPLVTVLREALARDLAGRADTPRPGGIESIRRQLRTRIQHINDFLKESYGRPGELPPHEHVIVFDEAQRAWDEKQGAEKFGRSASEPTLVLELMSRHPDWCVVVCLLGHGQEINSGEYGVSGWGDALRRLPPELASNWQVHAPEPVFRSSAEPHLALGELPVAMSHEPEPQLDLRVPQRNYRSPVLSQWVDALLDGDVERAGGLNPSALGYPIVITRSLAEARSWLKSKERGHRRIGLVASSGARRLRADGLGVTLNANAGIEIAHWYLNDPGDIRSSYALEVPVNEYTSQGLELDFIALCWGGDMLRATHSWQFARLNGPRWQRVKDPRRALYIRNAYRVLLTRAREGVVIYVPPGSVEDDTRRPEPFERTAAFLMECGVSSLTST